MNGRPTRVDDRGWKTESRILFPLVTFILCQSEPCLWRENRRTVSKYANEADQFVQVSENDQQYLD